MKRSRARLVGELVRDLRPVRRAPPPLSLALVWLAGSWLFAAGVGLATGPARPGLVVQLAQPRFLLELLLGVAAGALAIHAAAALGIPSPRPAARRAAPVLLVFAAWVASVAYGFYEPASAASMAGKREQCWLQILLYAAPPLAAALWLVRRSAPIARAWTGSLAGAAAAALPAALMQLACMYEPAHVLKDHLAPILVAALLGALLGPLALRRL